MIQFCLLSEFDEQVVRLSEFDEQVVRLSELTNKSSDRCAGHYIEIVHWYTFTINYI